MAEAYQQTKSSLWLHKSTFIFRTTLFLILWWWLTNDDLASWLFGLPVSLFAAFVSLKIYQPSSLIRLSVIPRFLVFFVKSAFLGSIDVAKRAMHPRLPIRPANIHYLTDLPSGAVLQVFIIVLGLLPGTLCLDIKGRELLIHVIDRDADVETELQHLEKLIAELFAGVRRHE